MSHRDLLLLSPQPLPTHHTLYSAEAEMAAFLNGHSALWHPAALALAGGPPRVASPYDHDPPRPNAIYAVAEACSGVLADDWGDRARQAGCLLFRPTERRDDTLADLLAQLRQLPPDQAPPTNLLDLDPGTVGPFLGVGFGLLHVDGLFEAMSHDNLLARDEFWKEVQEALGQLGGEDREAWRRHLAAAANHLLYAREVLYPSSVYLVDLTPLEAVGPQSAFPLALELGVPFNVLATGAALERLAREQPDRAAALRAAVQGDRAEVVLAGYAEREDAVLPLESQLWNLRRGLETAEALLGATPRVHGRLRFGAHPHLPGLLQSVGLGRATLFVMDDAVVPTHRPPVVNWPGWDGQQVETLTRGPQTVSPLVFLHLSYLLHQTMLQDLSATVTFLHKDAPDVPGYLELLELSRLGPVLGRWVTVSGLLGEVLASDYTPPAEADEFADNYLLERAPVADGAGPPPASPTITGLAEHHRLRRRFDATATVLAMAHGLGLPLEADGQPLLPALATVEDDLEKRQLDPAALDHLQQAACGLLAGRLVSRGAAQPGHLLVNPCAFTRRVVADLPGCTDLLPVEGPVKACQLVAGGARAVVEVPGFGFAWVPAQGQRGLEPNAKRMKLADDRAVRNEFFEAEIDPVTGGIRGVRDHQSRSARLAAQLVFHPGSVMRAEKVEVVSTGPGYGELATHGVLLDGQQQVVARYRLGLVAWIGRPLLEVHVDLQPVTPPVGYAWHAYYALRFATREERVPLIRGVCEVPSLGYHQRPTTPDYLEFRTGQQNAVVFPHGLPFHQRHGNKFLDVLLACPGETATRFELGVALDRPTPMQTAQGLLTPTLSVPTTHGPPHIGAAGWLFHLDAPNVLATSLRPVAREEGRAVVARLHEVGGHAGQAELHCPRNPASARLVDGRGQPLAELLVSGDAVAFDFGRHQLLQVEVTL